MTMTDAAQTDRIAPQATSRAIAMSRAWPSRSPHSARATLSAPMAFKAPPRRPMTPKTISHTRALKNLHGASP